jgi:hypothetical protein
VTRRQSQGMLRFQAYSKTQSVPTNSTGAQPLAVSGFAFPLCCHRPPMFGDSHRGAGHEWGHQRSREILLIYKSIAYEVDVMAARPTICTAYWQESLEPKVTVAESMPGPSLAGFKPASISTFACNDCQAPNVALKSLHRSE